MSNVLKYEMKCGNEDCVKTTIIIVDAEEESAPNVCPFCGNESFEVTGE